MKILRTWTEHELGDYLKGLINNMRNHITVFCESREVLDPPTPIVVDLDGDGNSIGYETLLHETCITLTKLTGVYYDPDVFELRLLEGSDQKLPRTINVTTCKKARLVFTEGGSRITPPDPEQTACCNIPEEPIVANNEDRIGQLRGRVLHCILHSSIPCPATHITEYMEMLRGWTEHELLGYCSALTNCKRI